MTMSASLSSTSVHVGEPVTVSIHAADPDAPVATCGEAGQSFDEPTSDSWSSCFRTASCKITMNPGPSGPWDPPPPSPSDETWSFTITFDSPGTKTIDLHFSSITDFEFRGWCAVPDPYESGAAQTLTLTVT
jgi:hypothetical protein